MGDNEGDSVLKLLSSHPDRLSARLCKQARPPIRQGGLICVSTGWL